ncbi:MAG: hypothetical protein DME00_25155 [Candidatus Rokuibacteriota bacterium]|nr:MAG: hypothetical protein DME00_25155 [Candidatus Rokubacteria bacterium]PYO16360.1 MAG: hypothetical protein DMD75_01225 [Candidatus Rokubacteria bacterium]
MRRSVLTAVLAFVILAMLAPPVFAQAPAGPPAPKVTITGTFDQITAAGRNFYDGNFSRDNDREWYARTRFRPDFEFAVGRTKAVLGIELDLNYGQTGSNDGGFPGNNSGTACGFVGGCKGAGSAGGGLDLNTDVAGLFEIKWIYTEFDLTGKDSILPFIPILTVARAGGQPFATIANYKVYYANGDFAGVDLYSTFTPDIKNHLAWVDVEDQLAGGNRAPALLRTNRGKDFAFIESLEVTPFKGLDLKPMYSYFHADGLTAGAARRNASNPRTVGGAMNVAAAVGGGAPAGDAADHENRHTVGLDARWRLGPFGLDPTISYQWGNYETQAIRTNGTVGQVKGDASAWLFDVIGSFQLGPLLLEGRGVYTTGNKARDNLSLSKRYYEPLDLDTGYWSGGWLGILGLGVDYFNGGGPSNQGMDTNVGYDRYGRMQVALRATYSITPALSLYGVVAPTWTAEKVDTDTGCPQPLNVANSATGCPARVVVSDKSFVTGDSRYIGTEVNGGFTWRFAANTAFDLAGYYLAAGPALKTSELLNGVPVKRDQHDGYYAAARVRLSF